MKREKHSEARTATIEREEVSTATWIPFFSGFNDRYHGRKARVEVRTPKGRNQTLFDRLSLQSVATTLGTPATTSGVDRRSPNIISITVLQPPGTLLTHKIDGVARVDRWSDPTNGSEGLEIESEEGQITMLTFGRE
jgi:hypothetical protein